MTKLAHFTPSLAAFLPSLAALSLAITCTYGSEGPAPEPQPSIEELRAQVAADPSPQHHLALGEALLAANQPFPATRHFRLAAEAQHPQALFRLGELQRDGLIVGANAIAAEANFLAAKNLGYGPAAFAWAQLAMQNPQHKNTDAINHAMAIIQTEASAGNASALRLLAAHQLSQGQIAIAWKTMEQAALQGDHLAQLHLSDRYRTGDGVAADRATAVRWLTMTLDTTDPFVLLRIGQSYLFGDCFDIDLAAGHRFLERSAAAGNGNAMCLLGVCYRDGRGVEADPRQALRWFQRSHGANCLPGTINLGHGYMIGAFGEPDHQQAQRILTIAADKNDPEAIHFLSILRRDGDPAVQDHAAARRGFETAAAAGYAPSMVELAWDIMNEEQLHSAVAGQWLAKAAALDHAEGHHLYAQYLATDPQQPDVIAAENHFRKAVALGSSSSLSPLAQILLSDPNPHRIAEAQQFLVQAAQVGDPSAFFLLGRINQLGLAGHVDVAAARMWYGQALQLGFAPAAEALQTLPPLGPSQP